MTESMLYDIHELMLLHEVRQDVDSSVQTLVRPNAISLLDEINLVDHASFDMTYIRILF